MIYGLSRLAMISPGKRGPVALITLYYFCKHLNTLPMRFCFPPLYAMGMSEIYNRDSLFYNASMS